MPVIASMAMLEEWLAKCVERSEAYPSAFHFDTGINRLGFRLSEAAAVRERIEKLGYAPQMVMSHLACADQPNHEKNRTQLALFGSVLSYFPGIPASLANSAALMTGRDYHFQMVRPGIALYGGRAVMGRANPMQPVVTLHVPILQVKEARTGGIGGLWRRLFALARQPARHSRAWLCGRLHAHLVGHEHAAGRQGGDPRAALPGGGRVSMDVIVVDITELGSNLPNPGEGAEVLGPNVLIDDQADAAGTIGYEILTSLKGRYTRNYVGDGRIPD